MQGIFQLTIAADLRSKLRRDIERLKSEPLNSDAAFNFFVTAEHLLDWVYSRRINKQRRTEARRKSVLLQVCSHLANGAKHVEAEDRQHDSVSSTGIAGGYFSASYFSPRYFSNPYFGVGRRLVIRLKGNAAAQLGQTISVIKLAEKVMEYWDNHSLI
jgi:hypothetical protein